MSRAVSVPGEVDDVAVAEARAVARAALAKPVAEAVTGPDDDELTRLRAELAAANAKLAAVPQVIDSAVYVPVTPKGALAMAASQFAHLTVAELMAKIDAGEAKEPFTSVLCRDGHYVTRRSMAA